MLELLFLLLPVAAAYGWYMGHRSAFRERQKKSDKRSRGYVDGVDFLLSNQQDKAVNLFLDIVKNDSNAFDAHLTLGNLFRSKGEVDRAIRTHQTLMDNGMISLEQQLLVTQQLGLDYMAAGLYDRAVGKFQQLMYEEDFRENALQQLLTIYQSISDWNSAIDVAERLVKLGKKKFNVEIAQFFCEKALLCLENSEENKSLSFLNKALSVDPNCVRASIMIGKIWIVKGDDEKAIHYLESVLEQDKEFISEALPLLKECYVRIQNPERWLDYLKRCEQAKVSNIIESMLADFIDKHEGREAAQTYMQNQLTRHPTMKGFYRLMQYHLEEAEEGRAKESLSLLKDMVGKQMKSKPRYCCEKCGFTSYSIYWHCPSCRSWASIKTVKGLDGE